MIGTNLQHAADLLKAGNLVAIPTETVYGLAANALNEQAVVEIYKAKNRPFFDPLIVHIHSVSQLKNYTTDIPGIALRLAEKFWPGPLTLVLKKKECIPDLVTAGLDSVAVRIPAHPLTLDLLRMLTFPLAAPSANPFGYISPTSAQHVEDQLGDKVPYILNGGTCAVGLESTIVGFSDSETPVILRLGGINVEEIEKVAGHIEMRISKNSNPEAPGQMDSHYAPRTPLILCESLEETIKKHQGKKMAILCFSKRTTAGVFVQEVLSVNADLDDAARNLFKTLRSLDRKNAAVIIAEMVPDKGLGRAINDRLKRAALV